MALFSNLYLYQRVRGSLGCAGLVGALLRLYLDRCFFGCKCSRPSYLELEFRLQVIISALYYMSHECMLRE